MISLTLEHRAVITCYSTYHQLFCLVTAIVLFFVIYIYIESQRERLRERERANRVTELEWHSSILGRHNFQSQHRYPLTVILLASFVMSMTLYFSHLERGMIDNAAWLWGTLLI